MSLQEFLKTATDRKNTLETRVQQYNNDYLAPFAKDLAQVAVALKATLNGTVRDLNNIKVVFNKHPLTLLKLDEYLNDKIKPEEYTQETAYVSIEVSGKTVRGSRSLLFKALLENITYDDFETSLFCNANKNNGKKELNTKTEATSENQNLENPEKKGNLDTEHIKIKNHDKNKPLFTEEFFSAVEKFLGRDEWMVFIDNLQSVCENDDFQKYCDELVAKNRVIEIKLEEIKKQNAIDSNVVNMTPKTKEAT